MSGRLTESTIEDFAIKLFERLGYDYIHAPDIAPDGDRPERSRYDEVLLTGRLESALKHQPQAVARTAASRLEGSATYSFARAAGEQRSLPSFAD